ncbi:MAG: HIT family protein [Gaiellaceae bacterium]
MSCVFCDIVAGRAPASVVHEDERTVTFLDVRPVATGHMLVAPRRHAASLAELDPEDGAQLFRVGSLGFRHGDLAERPRGELDASAAQIREAWQ